MGEDTTGEETTGVEVGGEISGGETSGEETTGVEAGGEISGEEISGGEPMDEEAAGVDSVPTDIRVDDAKVETKGPETEAELSGDVGGIVAGAVPVGGVIPEPILEETFAVGMLYGLLT